MVGYWEKEDLPIPKLPKLWQTVSVLEDRKDREYEWLNLAEMAWSIAGLPL